MRRGEVVMALAIAVRRADPAPPPSEVESVEQVASGNVKLTASEVSYAPREGTRRRSCRGRSMSSPPALWPQARDET